MSHIYTVSTSECGRTLMHVKADSKGAARRCATKDITVKRLDGGEILALHQNGYAIVDADTGRVIGEETDDNQAALNLPSSDGE